MNALSRIGRIVTREEENVEETVIVHKTLQERIEEFYGKDYDTVIAEGLGRKGQIGELDWGPPVGEEVW